jgi:hypothetical protein
MSGLSNSAASDVDFVLFGVRIIRPMRPSDARGKTAECIAERERGGRLAILLRLDLNDNVLTY